MHKICINFSSTYYICRTPHIDFDVRNVFKDCIRKKTKFHNLFIYNLNIFPHNVFPCTDSNKYNNKEKASVISRKRKTTI